MNLNAAIDIGNQRVKLATFAGSELLQATRFATGDWPVIFSWLTNQKPQNVILSTVGPKPGAPWESELRAMGYYLELNEDTPLPITNRYTTPKTLGKDRLAAVAGAFERYPGEDCLVVDAGTCITIDLLDAQGVFQGGSISPGLAMRLQAMHAFTARLPRLEPRAVGSAIGRSTEEAMRIGALHGAAHEIEGFARAFGQTYDKLRLLLTGGDAEMLAKALKSKIFVHRHLVLRGLNKILTYNVQQLA